MWSFSKHILERVEERGINEEMILKVVDKKVDILIYQSPQDVLVDLYFGKVEDLYILVVVNRETKNLITVRNMRKNEKNVYNKEFHL
jgi:hypothetical protein